MTTSASHSDTIVIVGMGGVFPGLRDATDLNAFWDLIVDGRSAAADVPAERWSVDPDSVYRTGIHDDHVYSRKACLLDAQFSLDMQGLNLDATLVEKLDPLFHVLLSAGRDAWQDSKSSTVDTSRCGIIVGNIALPTEYASRYSAEICGSLFATAQGLEDVFTPSATGDQETDGLNRYVAGLPAGVLAQALGLQGGTHTLDAACASSLYALKYAADELRAGRADCMLAGGVSRPDSLYTQMGFSQLHALSASGSCAPFSSVGDGLVVGEGAGIFVLKRLSDALEQGDRIYAKIAGCGLSNDQEGNLFLPASEGQERAMHDAYVAADWDVHSVDHIECHGTGTPTGDAIEFQSLRNLWASTPSTKHADTDTDTDTPTCVIGSVKSNVGHLLTGAGAAGLMKTLLAFQHKTLPPTANFTTANTALDMSNSPFEVLQSAQTWAQPAAHPRRAAMSAFGFGGINAHMLIEEYIDVPAQTKPKSKYKISKSKAKRRQAQRRQEQEQKYQEQEQHAEPIAIVGMAAQFGQWKNLDAVRNRMFNVHEKTQPTTPASWLGSPQAENFSSYSIDDLDIPIGRFRIPPTELAELLPQQILMLLMAADAVDDVTGSAQLADDAQLALRSGVYIGIGLDPQTCNFHLRWQLESALRQSWGADISVAQQDQWLASLRDACNPPLTANRTMGALGGIVASRVARALHCGGASFTVSNEECSGMQALETAVRSLRLHDIDQAIVGAVDFASDIRSVLSHHERRADESTGESTCESAVASDGAVAFVVKRLSDAERDGDRIYSCVRGISHRNGTDIDSAMPTTDAYAQIFTELYEDHRIPRPQLFINNSHPAGAARNHENIALAALLDARANHEDLILALSSAQADIGHSGAVSGLASVLKACLSLHHCTIPLSRACASEHHPLDAYQVADSRYWLHNADEGLRIAAATAISCDGNIMHTVLSEAPPIKETSTAQEQKLTPALTEFPHALFFFAAASTAELCAQLDDCRNAYAASSDTLHNFAASHPHSTGTYRCACVVSDDAHFTQTLAQLHTSISAATDLRLPHAFYTTTPLHTDAPNGKNGDIAYVFPGSGNHFAQMGSSISGYFPQVLKQQSVGSNFFYDQFASGQFWQNDTCDDLDHRDLIFGQVWYGAMMCAIMTALGMKPDAVIGYSLGETAGFFGTRTWRDRDGMLQRIRHSDLFISDLAGRCQAVRDTWNCQPDEDVNWSVALLDTPVAAVEDIIADYPRAYVLIINTPVECVIGGDDTQVSAIAKRLNVRMHPIEGVTTVHCEVAKPVATAYRNLHLFPCTPPTGVRFYSGIRSAAYAVTTNSAADSIIGQALKPFNYARTIQQAYDDGIRIFIEMGPRGTCSRMIDVTLADQAHCCVVASVPHQDGSITAMRSCAQLFAQGLDLHSSVFYQPPATPQQTWANSITVATGTTTYKRVPQPPAPAVPNTSILPIATLPIATPPIATPPTAPVVAVTPPPSRPVVPIMPATQTPAPTAMPTPAPAHSTTSAHSLLAQIQAQMDAQNACHAQFLALQQQFTTSMSHALTGTAVPLTTNTFTNSTLTTSLVTTPAPRDDVLFDYHDCMNIATGSIAAVLGDDFAVVDTYHTRVRLPDEPLMLAHRIMSIDAVKGSIHTQTMAQAHGSLITEHDVLADAWYLDCKRIPTCIAVEAGQADLFLSGYLGIDFIIKGQAVYRLLDAEVSFFQDLPTAGACISYDIRILEFFKQGDTHLFRFEFDATVNGQLLLTMRKGIAGFFTQAELDAGKGVILTRFDLAEDTSTTWTPPAPMPQVESYNEAQLQALRNGDLAGCFGSTFANNRGITHPVTIPDGRMRLVHRIKALTPNGGRFGLGLIVGEADIHPDDWFLTCHFCDDMVMPGTLMYECCLHTLRVYLLRMGWIGDADAFGIDGIDEIHYEPIEGIASILQCRGQVLQSTKLVTYELCIQEIGYRGDQRTPYVIADAIMYADGKRVVRMKNMSMQIRGLTEAKITAMWSGTTHAATTTTTAPARDPDLIPQEAIFNDAQITAYAEGKPSEAFGDRYTIFDNYENGGRKIARLPRDPFKFINRITHIRDCQQWEMKAGGTIVARYDVPPDAWYFASNEQSTDNTDHPSQQRMPFAVLLETALQPCGWMAAYVGSGLTAEHDLKFRNLGGKATQYIDITPDIGTLSTKIHMSNVSSSGGMVIQNYDMEMWCDQGLVYKGDTVFGFFSSDALATQVGLRDAKLYQPNTEARNRAESFPFPTHAPFPDDTMRMIQDVTHCDMAGGSKNLGYLEGCMPVNPDSWFFQAHFYQDPVIPGSLGLESFQQLLKVAAWKTWAEDGKSYRFNSMPLEHQHTWLYRGQVVPADTLVTVKVDITNIEDLGSSQQNHKKITAKGYLTVDGRIIYQMIQFALEMIEV